MSGPRVLVLSTQIGAGHVRAAEAILDALHKHSPQIVAEHIECLRHLSAPFRVAFAGSYNAMLSHFPRVWRWIYERTEKQSPDTPFKRFSAWFACRSARRLQREILRFNPDCIVCTHFVPAAVAAWLHRTGRIAARTVVVVTDYEAHPVWLYAGVDRYCVASESVAEAMTKLGVPSSQLRATGVPIFEQFAAGRISRRDVCLRLGLDADRPTVLITGGGWGLGALDDVARGIGTALPNAQLLAVAGKSEAMRVRLESLRTQIPAKMFAFGFVSNMHELMAASDVIVTKPGGVTSSECLCMRLPMVLTRPIPGQEERNAAFLTGNGGALSANSLADVVQKTTLLLNDSELRRRVRDAQQKISKPQAAADVASVAVSLCENSALPDFQNAPARLYAQKTR